MIRKRPAHASSSDGLDQLHAAVAVLRVRAPEVDCDAVTLRDALQVALDVNLQLRAYILDDQGDLRSNVVCFVDGQRSRDLVAQGDRLRPDSRIHVLQALSGG